MKNNILITGATGKLGSLVAETLLNKIEASQILVMARDRAKAKNLEERGIQVRIGNYDDKASMTEAFSDIDKIYFVSGTDLEKRIVQHVNVVEAAEEAGVNHLIYTSFGPNVYAENSPLYTIAKGHLAAEEALKNSNIAYTILKHN